MDEKQEKFLARLRETFQVEAAEHLAAISSGVVAIEHATGAERGAIAERIFREAHSLKGAARSVSLGGVETLCAELESVLAAVKRDELRLSAEALDAIHVALGVIGAACQDSGAPRSQAGREQEQQVRAALARIVSGAPAPLAQPLAPIAAAAAAPGTVRVSTVKLGAILREAEELVGAKAAAHGRAAELRALAAELTEWNQGRIRLTGPSRGRDAGTSRSDLIESELLHTRALESSLRKLAAATHQDAFSLSAITERLLEDTKQVLLLPCSYLLGALPTVVRDLARDQGKEVGLLVSGEDIEIDRRVLDELKDPLIHLLRNCVDHGIEKPELRRGLGKPSRGSVTLTVSPVEGSRLELTLADDGGGIDTSKVGKAAVRLGLVAGEEADRLTAADLTALVFHSGLSTSPIIGDLSGRGLGLAIVREKVEKLGGTVGLTSTLGAGTTFRLLVPSTLATFRGVVVGVVGRNFVIPSASIVRVGRVRSDEIKTVGNRQTVTLGDRAVSLVRLRDVLELSGPDRSSNGAGRLLAVLRAADRQIAFVVDEVLGEQEVLVKSLGPQLVRVRNVAGAAVSGSGAVLPILNVADLVASAVSARTLGPIDAAVGPARERRSRLLIAEDSITARTLVKAILEGAGYEVVATVDGMDALIRLKTEPFDLVVSDVDMPRLNGFELTAKIRADKQLSELPVVLVTALGSALDREYGIEVGANAYIVKSDFDQSNLLEIIRRLL